MWPGFNCFSPDMSNQSLNSLKSGSLPSTTRKKNVQILQMIFSDTLQLIGTRTRQNGLGGMYTCECVLNVYGSTPSDGCKALQDGMLYLTLGWTYTAHQRCNKSIPSCQDLSGGLVCLWTSHLQVSTPPSRCESDTPIKRNLTLKRECVRVIECVRVCARGTRIFPHRASVSR